jgi:hypothetical protein
VSVVIAEGVVELRADVSSVPGDVSRSLGGADPLLTERGRSSGKAFIGGLIGAAAIAGIFSIGVNIGQAISDGVRAGFDFTLEGVGLASDLSETRAAIGEVFGGAAADVEAFAASANTALGQTQQQALDGAKTFGIFGTAAGLTGQPLSDFSTDFLTLASDLASFNNTSPEAAITAIGAALRGEAEPIRAYGVLLDDASIRAQAFTMGLTTSATEALTPQQKILAVQALISAQTETQQGDFLRTSDGLANQQRILAASFEDAQTKLGTALLPAMTTLVTFANDELMPILSEVIDSIGPQLGDAVVELLPAFLDLAREIAPLIPSLVELGLSAMPGIITAAEILLPLMLDWTENTEAVFTMIDLLFQLMSGDTTIEEMVGKVGGLGGSLADTAKGVGDFVRGVTSGFFEVLSVVGETIGGAISWLVAMPGQAVAAIGNVGRTLYSSGRAIIQGFIDGVSSMFSSIGASMGGVMDFIEGFFPHSPAKRGPFSGAGWDNLAASGGALLDQFRSGMSGEIELSASFGGAGMGAGGAGYSAAQRLAPTIVIERVVLDASNIRQISDLVDMFAALPQVSRASAPMMGA